MRWNKWLVVKGRGRGKGRGYELKYIYNLKIYNL